MKPAMIKVSHQKTGITHACHGSETPVGSPSYSHLVSPWPFFGNSQGDKLG